MKVVVALLLFAVPALAGEPPTLDELLEDLGSPGYQTRRKAVLAVEGRVEPELLDRIFEMARTDPHPNIRGYCAQVLGTFRDDRVFPLLKEMAKGGKWPGPRQHALVALGRLGDARGYEILVEALGSGNTDRAYAVKGLGVLGDPRGFAEVEKLYRGLTNDPWLMDMAPTALLQIDEARAADLLLDLFTKVKPAPRHSIVRSLREQPTSKVRVAMTAMLDSEDSDLRLSAIRLLGKAGDAGTVARLLGLLSGSDKERGAAATALREIGDVRAARPVAVALSRERDTLLKATLLRTLAELGDARAVATIAPLLDDAGSTPQPRTISSIWGYPHNLHVKAAALWALRTLVDGEPPFALKELSLFPLPAKSGWAERRIPEVKAWWEKHRSDPRYRFPE